MDINPGLLRTLGNQYNQKINTMFCTQETIASVLPQTDMIINYVKWPKQRKDFLITKEMLKTMEPGSVLVDISNDDPGAIESAMRPITTIPVTLSTALSTTACPTSPAPLLTPPLWLWPVRPCPCC